MSGSVIKKGAIISYVAIFLNIAITFFYTPWMIHKIGVSDYGLYSLVISFISYFIMDFGLTLAIQRFIARYRAEDNIDKVSKMIGITTRVYLIIDAIIFLILFVLYFFISNIFTGLTTEEIEKLKGLYIIAGTFSVLNFVFKPMSGAMMAFEYFVEERLLEMVYKVGLVVIVCIALYLGAGVYALVLANGAIALFTSIAKFCVFKNKSKLKIQWSYYDKNEMKNIFSFSMWTFTSSMAQRLRINLIPTILGIASNSTEIAIFSLAMSIEGMIVTISSALNGLFLPKVTRLSLNGDRHEITTLMIRVGRLQTYIWGLIFSGFCVFGPTFIHLWVGPGFSKSYYIVIMIAIASVFSLTQSIANDLIYAENKIKQTAIRSIITAVIGFAIAFPLAKNYGAIGAAAGSGFGLCLYQLLLNIFYKKDLKLELGRFFRECHLKTLPAIVILMGANIFIVRNFLPTTWHLLIVGVVLYTLLFCAISYCFLFNAEEKKHVSLIKPKKT